MSVSADAVAQVLASVTQTGMSDQDLINSLLGAANLLATNANSATNIGNSLGAGAQLEPEVPQELAALADSLSIFRSRYPCDARAYDFLIHSPPTVVATVLRDFRPPRENETDYSGLLTVYVKKVRQSLGGDAGFGGQQSFGGGQQSFGGGQQSFGGQQQQQYQQAPQQQRGGGAYSQTQTMDLSGDFAAFLQKYPIDDRAYQFVVNSPQSIQLRLLQEFRPRREGEQDYSALVTSFCNKMTSPGKGGGKGQVVAPLRQVSSFGQMNQTGQMNQAQFAAESSLSSAPADLLTALTTPGFGEFFGKYPIDERAYDFFAQSPPEVQQKVMQDFRPKVENEASYSGLFTAYVKKTRVLAMAPSGKGMGGFQQQQFQTPAFEPGFFPQEQAPVGPAPDLDSFRLRYPMDDRAWEFLCSCPELVQSMVIQGFQPMKPTDTDFSAPVTAYVRSTRQRLQQEDPYQICTAQSVDAFFRRYPCDERARDYFNNTDPRIISKMLLEFKPRSEGDLDYSAAVTSFIKRGKMDMESGYFGLGGKGEKRKGNDFMGGPAKFARY